MAFCNISGRSLKAHGKYTVLCPVLYSAILRQLFRWHTFRMIGLPCSRYM
jgi:hypothetical protein